MKQTLRRKQREKKENSSECFFVFLFFNSAPALPSCPFPRDCGLVRPSKTSKQNLAPDNRKWREKTNVKRGKKIRNIVGGPRWERRGDRGGKEGETRNTISTDERAKRSRIAPRMRGEPRHRGRRIDRAFHTQHLYECAQLKERGGGETGIFAFLFPHSLATRQQPPLHRPELHGEAVQHVRDLPSGHTCPLQPRQQRDVRRRATHACGRKKK